MAVTLSEDEGTDHESESDQEGNFMAFTPTAVISETEIVMRTLMMGNSLKMLTWKKHTKSFARLQQKMPWILNYDWKR